MEYVKKKRSNLVMPTHYQELTREEMEYVAGMLVCGVMGRGVKVGLEVGWFKVSTVCTYL